MSELTREQLEMELMYLLNGTGVGGNILAHDAALRQEIDRLTAERDAWRQKYCDAVKELAQAEQEREQSWNRFAVVGNHADFLQRLDTLLLTSAQAEQERERLRAALEIILSEAEGHMDKVVCLRHLSRIKREAQQALSPKEPV